MLGPGKNLPPCWPAHSPPLGPGARAFPACWSSDGRPQARGRHGRIHGAARGPASLRMQPWGEGQRSSQDEVGCRPCCVRVCVSSQDKDRHRNETDVRKLGEAWKGSLSSSSPCIGAPPPPQHVIPGLPALSRHTGSWAVGHWCGVVGLVVPAGLPGRWSSLHGVLHKESRGHPPRARVFAQTRA